LKRFTFPLEQVRSWNATQLQIEEAALEVIVDQQRRTEAAYAELCAQRAEFEHSTLHKAEIESTELVRLGEFRTFVAVEGNRLRVARLQFEREIAQRRARLIELRRKIELFDRLKQRQRAAWTAEEAKELQAAADEAFLQKLVARRE
jgi:hypothetical protein